MKAIIVPGVTDLNKGDQALVWESYRLIKDLKLFSDIHILEGGDTKEEKDLLCSQTRERGYNLVKGILKHPRRGQHASQDHVKESKMSYLRLITNGVLDFTTNSSVIIFSKNNFLSSVLFSNNLLEKIQIFRDCDVVFVKGGGFLHAHGEFFSPYLIWYFLFYLRLATRLGKKVVVLPNSFGPFDGLTVQEQIKSVLTDCDLIYAREKVSADAISKVIDKKINVRPDLGFYLRPSHDTDKINSIMNKYNLTNSDKIVGITVRPWRFPGHKNTEELYKRYIESIAEFASYVTKKGYKAVVCNQSIGPNSHEDDRNAIRDLLVISNDIIWINENLHCDVLKALYSRFFCLLGTRFHSVIFSLTSLIPCIAIGYGGNKAKGIMTDFGLNEFVIPIELVKEDNLIYLFEEIERNYEVITSKLLEGVNVIESERNLMIDEIRKAIKQ
ncbi:polysaccharide pyruvyl transferase family protein [Psychrobacter sp. TAE2020]|uniref:polysaccharide pyruvyl transferase family protein n=1 Tax=Psychrobacter sp. TAE2020 TaxID=2846762 RepID=UPI001C10DE2C|nr:polysaccharide pyruvyl transferase family protein [Psychrobacter sp. TAE2020]MBU5616450.1 polysaccharide pyruvyl transferase family protein [Psychrobacter sp. TAE2020]